MKPKQTEDGLWAVTIEGVPALVNVIGTYGDHPDPVVYVEEGPHQGSQLAINWDTGRIVRNITAELMLYGSMREA